MITKFEVTGIRTYLLKLTHNILTYDFKFENLEFDVDYRNRVEISYDLNITSRGDDTPWLWDYFDCKSKHILQDACEIVDLPFSIVYPKLRNLTVNGVSAIRYSGLIPISFEDKINKLIKENTNKEISVHFFCGNEKKFLRLTIEPEVSEIFIDDGITSDISVYVEQATIDGKPLENLTEDIVETIVGYVQEYDDLRLQYDNIVWDEVSKYMDLESCELWGHTYTYIRNIGGIEPESYDYVAHSTFSSKLCDFISGY